MMGHGNQVTVSDEQSPWAASTAAGTKLVSCILQIAALIVALAMALFGCAWWSAGSFELAWPLLRGERLVFVPTAIQCGIVPRGEIIERKIRVVNLSSRPLKLTGSQSSCQCISLDEFPIVIRQGKEHPLAIKFGAPKTTGPFEHSIKIFTDDRGSSAVIVKVAASVE